MSRGVIALSFPPRKIDIPDKTDVSKRRGEGGEGVHVVIYGFVDKKKMEIRKKDDRERHRERKKRLPKFGKWRGESTHS